MSWRSELELEVRGQELGVGGGVEVRGRRADWRTRACCGPGVILTTSVKARVKARASKSCWWGARKLRVGRAGRAQASVEPSGGTAKLANKLRYYDGDYGIICGTHFSL